MHTVESPTNTAMTSVRMRVLTGNQRYELHGCVPTVVQFSPLTVPGPGWIDITWAVAWWEEINTGTFPSTLATDSSNPSPITAGSVFLAAVGTATRANNTYVAREVGLEWTLNTMLLRGYGGVNRGQEIVGARRGPATIKLSLTVDAEANTATPTLPSLGRGTSDLHSAITCSTSAGSALGFYFPRLCAVNVPVQIDVEGINRFRIEMVAYTGGTTTSELTQSAARMAWA
jgi:hypothetical protein